MLGRLAVPFLSSVPAFFLKQSLGNSPENEGLSGQNRKNLFVWEFRLPPLMPGSFSPSCLSLSSRNLDCSGLLGNVLPTLVYSCFLLGLFLVNQLVKRLGYGLDGVITFLLYCWGLIETYSAYLDTTSLLKGYQLYSNLFLQREMVSFTRLFLSIWVIICMTIFMHKLLEFTVGKS